MWTKQKVKNFSSIYDFKFLIEHRPVAPSRHAYTKQ